VSTCQRFSKPHEQAHAVNISLPGTIQQTPGTGSVAPEPSCAATNSHPLFLRSSSPPLCNENGKTHLHPLQPVELCLEIFSKLSGKGVQVKQEMLCSDWNSKKVVLRRT